MSKNRETEGDSGMSDLPGFNEGIEARRSGNSLAENPFSWKLVERQNWHAGWHEEDRAAHKKMDKGKPKP